MTITVAKSNQTITWNQTLSATYGNPPITLNATASSGLVVAYTSSNPSVASVSGKTLTIVGVGSATITASQAGNTNYNAATNVAKTITVAAPAKSNQTITWNQTLSATYGDPPITLNATASSGLVITYISSNPSIASVSGSTLTIVGIGSATITASQAGNANYNAATNVAKTIIVNQATVTKSNQTITWNQTLSATYGDPPITLNATASSGLAITYTSSNTSVVTVSGNTLTTVGVGSATITASQTGNANYYAATDVAKTITVTQNSQNQDNYFQPDPAATYYIIHSSGLFFKTTTIDNPYPYSLYSDGVYNYYYNLSYITDPDYSSDQQYKFFPVSGKTAVYNIMPVSSDGYIGAANIQETSTDGYLCPFTNLSDYSQFQIKSTGTGYYTISCQGYSETGAKSFWGTYFNTDTSIVWTNKDGTNFLDYWKIVETSKTSINPVVASNTAIVYAKDGLLTINHLVGTNRIYIYTIAGQLMENLEVKESNYSKALPNGNYVVVIKGDSSYRGVVIVK